MGLDITAYGAAFKCEESDYAIRAYVNPDFPGRNDSIETGCYRCSGPELRFRGGSYSGYNRWREELARLVGTTPDDCWEHKRPGPFYELIDFSDCEGVIGPDTSKKLAADFAEWDARAKEFESPIGWFYSNYKLWRCAFDIASEDGFVRFH